MLGKVSYGGVTTPAGFRASSANGDIKGKKAERDDCGLIYSDVPCEMAAVFTSNVVKAAPVLYDMEILNKGCKVSAVFANSGNANACTGAEGLKNCQKIADVFAEGLNIKSENVLIASTGVIGVPLPVEKIIDLKDVLIDGLADDNGINFAKAIMTTDTTVKETAVCVETKSGIITIGGCTKGAGMISPNLATMLTFITTDALIDKKILQKALNECTELTFNRVTVDGDMSTNDTVILLANGMSGTKVTENENYEDFKAGLLDIMDYLARQIALDGEGATRMITVEVKNAANNEEARLCASKIANSPLVKTMFAGCDPNWGRLMSSAGASGAKFDPYVTDIYFNDMHYVAGGKIIDYALEEKAYNIMKEMQYTITIDLHAGSGYAKFYTCDLTQDYIKINADYRS